MEMQAKATNQARQTAARIKGVKDTNNTIHSIFDELQSIKEIQQEILKLVTKKPRTKKEK